MQRRLIILLLVTIAAAMVPAFGAAYYAVFTDGTWIPAVAEPEVVEGKARIPLRGGMIAVLDADLIDWPASKESSAAGQQPKGPHAVPGKGLAAHVVFTNAAPASGAEAEGTASAPGAVPVAIISPPVAGGLVAAPRRLAARADRHPGRADQHAGEPGR